MTRPFISPFRRFLHSSACARVASSVARQAAAGRAVVSDDGPPAVTASAEASRRVLTAFVDEVAAANDYSVVKKEAVNSGVLAFRNQSFIRPIDMHRDFHKPRSARRRPAPVGPGRESRYNDAFLQLGIDPRRESENFKLMSDFASRMGKIQPRNITLLSQRSQRLVGKAVKRAKMMGIIPIMSNSKYVDTMLQAKQRRQKES